MGIINATKARDNLYQLISDVNSNSEPITIVNSRGKNAVLLSESDWNAIQETLYLNSIPGMAESIISGGQTEIDDCIAEDEVIW